MHVLRLFVALRVCIGWIGVRSPCLSFGQFSLASLVGRPHESISRGGVEIRTVFPTSSSQEMKVCMQCLHASFTTLYFTCPRDLRFDWTETHVLQRVIIWLKKTGFKHQQVLFGIRRENVAATLTFCLKTWSSRWVLAAVDIQVYLLFHDELRGTESDDSSFHRLRVLRTRSWRC